MNCKYCEVKETELGNACLGKIIVESGYEEAAIDVKSKELVIMGDDVERAKINYCPMRGKKFKRERTALDDILDELNSDGDEQ
ncbi:hypothetical protein IW492_02790 [Enterococcus sp. BWB1-3]|uniref:hypothetical protein n=1 Tax=Enterococcus sp. BWB1-3 TaxID=2787713 RepID=UPI001921F209|nr:hypothetical protein [Enterococcus sp. BWB1-3]MBL1228158.1 hypothetical protein [Enterococcus sp. BWB1-3]